MKNIDLKGLNEELKRFAKNHPQINMFKSTPDEEATGKDLEYPLMWVNLGNADPSQGAVTVSLDVLFVDRTTDGADNYIDVMNDMLRLFNDYYTMYNENEEDYEFIIEVDATAVPIKMQYDNSVCGYKTSTRAILRNYRNEEQIPR